MLAGGHLGLQTQDAMLPVKTSSACRVTRACCTGSFVLSLLGPGLQFDDVTLQGIELFALGLQQLARRIALVLGATQFAFQRCGVYFGGRQTLPDQSRFCERRRQGFLCSRPLLACLLPLLAQSLSVLHGHRLRIDEVGDVTWRPARELPAARRSRGPGAGHHRTRCARTLLRGPGGRPGRDTGHTHEVAGAGHQLQPEIPVLKVIQLLDCMRSAGAADTAAVRNSTA